MARRPRDVSWPDDPEVLPHPVVDNHTHLDAVLDATASGGWAGSGERSLSVEDHLTRAAQIMWERDCGAVPVIDAGGRLAGGRACHVHARQRAQGRAHVRVGEPRGAVQQLEGALFIA